MSFRIRPPRLRSRADDVASVAALDDETRKSLYEYVSVSSQGVSRDAAAAALGLTRRVAAFNLDRLVDRGLLEVTFRRLTGRTGPGAGRPTKLYRRSEKRIDVSVPPRNYELLARLLAAGAGPHEASPDGDRLNDAARDAGVAIGRAAREAVPGVTQAGSSALTAELAEQGFEPFTDDGGTIRLRNCPFHEIARENTKLVCTMNLAFMQGVADGVGASDLQPVLDPREGACCVAFRQEAKP